MSLLNFPGWSIEDNPYGPEFDLSARMRMIETSNQIKPYLENMGRVLELGPWFNPHILTNVTHVEKDEFAAKYLGAIQYDLNDLPNKEIESKIFSKYDSVVISHLLNYVDYVKVLDFAINSLKSKGKIVIANITNFGAPIEFHEKRPKSVNSIVNYLENKGFTVEKNKLKPLHKIQKNSTWILVAKK